MRRLVVCLPLLLAACGSVETYFGDVPRNLEGFPIQTTEGQIYATASLGDPERDLGVDLVDEAGVLPIFLKIQKNAVAKPKNGAERWSALFATGCRIGNWRIGICDCFTPCCGSAISTVPSTSTRTCWA